MRISEKLNRQAKRLEKKLDKVYSQQYYWDNERGNEDRVINLGKLIERLERKEAIVLDKIKNPLIYAIDEKLDELYNLISTLKRADVDVDLSELCRVVEKYRLKFISIKV